MVGNIHESTPQTASEVGNLSRAKVMRAVVAAHISGHPSWLPDSTTFGLLPGLAPLRERLI